MTTVIPAPGFHSMHRIEYYLHLVEKAGLTVFDRHTEFFFDAADEDNAAQFLAQQGYDRTMPLVGLNPGGNWGQKRWPEAHWVLLAKMLTAAGYRVVITGSSQDESLAQTISAGLQPTAMRACGVLDLSAFAALCTKLDVFITADTGPLHIANAVMAKHIIALFGPTDARLTGPYPPGRAVVMQEAGKCEIPCYNETCADARCMKALMPEDVFARVSACINCTDQ